MLKENKQRKSIIFILKNNKSNLRLIATNLISTDKALISYMKLELTALLLLPTWKQEGRAGSRCHP